MGILNFQFIKVVTLDLFLIFVTTHAANANYELTHHCEGNSWATCYIRFDGVIESGLAEKLERVLSAVDYPTIYLNSPGGDLGEAMAAGRVIRRFGRDTRIGLSRDWDYVNQPSYAPSPGAGGACESACAYLFMGGVSRDVYEYPSGSIDDIQLSRIGFHRFYSRSNILNADETQIASGLLVEYLVEMGIDARLFLAASKFGANEMYYLTEEDALNYDVIFPTGFGNLTMEPYLDGVISYSRRLDLPDQIRPHNHTTQISFFCEGGGPRILITSRWRGVSQVLSQTEPQIGRYHSPNSLTAPSSFVSVRQDSEYTYITIQFPATWRSRVIDLVDQRDFYVGLFASNASGGDFGGQIALSDLDLEMIRSSFSLCIR